MKKITHKDVIHYHFLLLKIPKDAILKYTRAYFKKEDKPINDEAMRIFIELMIIAIVEKCVPVTERYDMEYLQPLKDAWGDLFPKLKFKYSAVPVLQGSENKAVDVIARYMQPHVSEYLKTLTRDVALVPYRQTISEETPKLSNSGIQTIISRRFIEKVNVL